MKIGIMTFWWSEDNYGQLLQCYALQKYLRDQGHDAFLIRYDPRKDFKKDSLRLLKIFNLKVLFFQLKKLFRSSKPMNRQFDDFRNNFIKATDRIYYHYRELVENPPVADMYITGSDQVWNFPDNFTRYENLINAYFLNFGSSKIKRVSFAASFSRKNINTKLCVYLSPLLKRFDHVTVRENEGLSLCAAIGYKNAKLILDPTFLLSPDQYPTVENRMPESKYIFVYLLGSNCKYPKTQIEKFAAEKKLNINYVFSQGNNTKGLGYNATIQEWLSLIKYSDYVITNSFHGTVFSILFEKKFAVLPLTGFFSETNTRLHTLLSLFDLDKNLYSTSIGDCLSREINWLTIKNEINQHYVCINSLFL